MCHMVQLLRFITAYLVSVRSACSSDATEPNAAAKPAARSSCDGMKHHKQCRCLGRGAAYFQHLLGRSCGAQALSKVQVQDDFIELQMTNCQTRVQQDLKGLLIILGL